VKTCTRFHFEDVERGDRLFLGDGRIQEFNTERDPDVTITVARAYSSRAFGPVVLSDDGETYYLNDYDTVRQA